MISQSSITTVLETAQIDEVISDYVQLKKRGANYLGLCPFHNEKTPSFTVSPSKGIYKCFGCGAAGNTAKFLMEHEHLSFPEAIELLAERYQIELDYSGKKVDSGEEEKLESVYIVNSFATRIFRENINSDNGKAIAMSYLKERGLDQIIIEKFELGYALDQKNFLLQKALNNGFKKEMLSEAGLITKDKSKDFFRNRIMFPIHNLSGKVIGFGGRTLQKNTKAPKYINTAESAIYQKGKVLYGMFQARNNVRREEQCFLVEGYTDVLAMVQAGIENVVASSGTALTTGQINLIKRYSPNLTIIYDGDEAGKAAAARGSDIALEEGLNVSILILPENDDPDSYIRNNGAAAFQEYFEKHREDYILYKTRIAARGYENDPVKKAELTNEVVRSIAKISDPIKRSYYLKECSKLLSLNEQILVTECNKARRAYISSKQKKREIAQEDALTQKTYKYISEELHGIDEQSYLEMLERDLIRLMMEYGSEFIDDEQRVTAYILEELEHIEIENLLYEKTIAIIRDEFDKDNFPSQEFYLHHENEKISSLAIELLTSPYEISDKWYTRFDVYIADPFENFQKDIESSVTRFKLYKLKKMIDQNNEKLKEAKDEKLIHKLQQTHIHLHEMKQELSRILGTVVFK